MSKIQKCKSHPWADAVGVGVHSVRVSATERRDVETPWCADCMAEYNHEQAVNTPYTKDWHFAQVDRLASQMRRTVADWFEASRDDERTIRKLYGEMLTASRSLAAELGAIGEINYQESVR